MSYITPDIGDIVRNKVDHERYGFKYTGIVINRFGQNEVQVMWVMDNFGDDPVVVDWDYSDKLKLAKLND